MSKTEIIKHHMMLHLMGMEKMNPREIKQDIENSYIMKIMINHKLILKIGSELFKQRKTFHSEETQYMLLLSISHLFFNLISPLLSFFHLREVVKGSN